MLKIRNWNGLIEADIKENGRTDITVTVGDEEFTGRNLPDPVLAMRIAKRAAHRMRYPRPALMSHVCQGWHSNPAYCPDFEGSPPALLQCDKPATRRIVGDDGFDCYTVKLCSRCAQVWRREAAVAGVEIVSDEPIIEVAQ